MSPREREIVKIARKFSQALYTHSASNFKTVIRVNLTRDKEVTTEDAALAENSFGPDVGGLKGNNTRSKQFLMQSEAIEIP